MAFATANGAATQGATTKNFTGFVHLANETVHVVNKAGTLYYGSVVVGSSGDITLPEEASDIVVGLDFDRKITLLPPDLQAPDGKQTGKPMRLSRVFLEVYDTVDVKVGDARLWVRNVTSDLSQDPEPVSEMISFRLGGYSREPLLEIIQEDPLNFTLLAATLEVKV